MSTFYKLDLRAWPKVRISFNGEPSDAAYDEFIKDLDTLYESKTNFTILFDTRNIGKINLKYADKIGKWIKANRENAKKYLTKTSILITNPATRLFVKMVIRISPPASPLEICGTLRDCVKYLGWLEI